MEEQNKQIVKENQISSKKNRKKKKKINSLKAETIKNQRLASFASYAFTDESERKSLLMTQAANLIIAVSVLTAFYGCVFAVVIEYFNLDTKMVTGCFLFIIMPLLASFIMSTIIQWRMKYRAFQNGYKYEKRVESALKTYHNDPATYDFDLFLAYSDKALKMEQNNNKRAGLALASHICIFASIGMFLIACLHFIFS